MVSALRAPWRCADAARCRRRARRSMNWRRATCARSRVSCRRQPRLAGPDLRARTRGRRASPSRIGLDVTSEPRALAALGSAAGVAVAALLAARRVSLITSTVPMHSRVESFASRAAGRSRPIASSRSPASPDPRSRGCPPMTTASCRSTTTAGSWVSRGCTPPATPRTSRSNRGARRRSGRLDCAADRGTRRCRRDAVALPRSRGAVAQRRHTALCAHLSRGGGAQRADRRPARRGELGPAIVVAVQPLVGRHLAALVAEGGGGSTRRPEAGAADDAALWMTLADHDSRAGDPAMALEALERAEMLGVTLPTRFAQKRDEWRELALAGSRPAPPVVGPADGRRGRAPMAQRAANTMMSRMDAVLEHGLSDADVVLARRVDSAGAPDHPRPTREAMTAFLGGAVDTPGCCGSSPPAPISRTGSPDRSPTGGGLAHGLVAVHGAGRRDRGSCGIRA